MGLNHSVVLLKANAPEIKFINGGLESYEGVKQKDITTFVTDDESLEPGNIREFSFSRNSRIYSWLADLGHGVFPIDNWRELGKSTREFLKWLSKPTELSERVRQLSGPGVHGSVKEDGSNRHLFTFEEEHLLDGGAAILLPFDFLHKFNYDEVALDSTDEDWDEELCESIPINPEPNKEGKTYRQLFCESNRDDFFVFLRKAKELNYDAVLIVIA